MNITFYPHFTEQEALSDHFYRMVWYLRPFDGEIQVTIPHELDAQPVLSLPKFLDPILNDYGEAFSSAIFFDVEQSGDISKLYEDTDIFLIWSGEFSASHEPFLGKKVVRINHNEDRFAGSYYLKIAEFLGNDLPVYRKKSNYVFSRLLEECSSSKGYVFGTGPSLSQASNYDYSDGVTIACNSMVRNLSLLDHLKPKIIAIADPIFHAGPSKYAGTFRRELIEAMNRYDSYLVVPMRDYHIYLGVLPKEICEKLIAIEYVDAERPILDLEESLAVTSTANVLTLFLLPLASSLFEQIAIVGCDGKPAKENEYFWSHDNSSQITEEMENIKLTHPAFFKIDYEDYYETHCETLDIWLAALEVRGKSITTLTPSYIPALRSRYKDPLWNSPGIAELIVLDPDAKDYFGHFVSMDDRLGEACGQQNIEFSVFCNTGCHSEVMKIRPHWHPIFSLDSSTLARRVRRRNEAQVADVALFKEELSHALDLRRQKGLTRSTLLYMYCGSLPHAKAISEVIEERKEISAVICLFWLYSVDYRDRDYIREWKHFIQSCDRHSRVKLTVPVARLGKSVSEVFGVDLSLAPHSSTTFSDAVFDSMLEEKPVPHLDRSKRSLKILFPGGSQYVKGFHLTAEHGPRMAEQMGESYEIIIRVPPKSNVSESTDALVSRLEDSECKLVSADMDDDLFASFLSDSDIIVLPYQSPEFSERTSGLLIDAIYLGKPVVVWDDTWLSDVVRMYNNGVIVRDSDYRSFEEAIFLIAKNHERYGSAARKARRLYFKSNSWAKLVNSMLSQEEAEQMLDHAERNSLLEEYSELVKAVPTRAPIFLPTEKIPLLQRLSGIKKVKEIYDDRLDSLYRPKLKELQDKYAGSDRCFIIGNGPSLNRTDLSMLKDEVTFAVNGFFLKSYDLDWVPTFYVVEDHLVAEDRGEWINAFDGPTKLFPVYLAYCLDENDDTVFFNHQARVSYPEGFDFSQNASDITYAGCTVTFTCMQLAFYLGFKEIYLVGVDASYAIPKDVSAGDEYNVGVLDMQSDDPNHFHPDYFGKGFRWHDPQVDKMVEAYEEARRVTAAAGSRIINATVGGELEVFERMHFGELFPDAITPDDMIRRTEEEFDPDTAAKPGDDHLSLSVETEPRLLIFDLTRVGDSNATGKLKESFLAQWPKGKYAQFYALNPDSIGFADFVNPDIKGIEEADVAELIFRFQPDLILYRPVPDCLPLHQFAMKSISEIEVPLMTWIMDDWPSRLAHDDPGTFEWLDKDLRLLFDQSKVRLSISEQMSAAFQDRYGVPFNALANGVNPTDWAGNVRRSELKPFRVRYAGSLAPDMTLDSVLRIAQAIESIEPSRGIIFEIRTNNQWKERSFDLFSGLEKTEFVTREYTDDEYREWLQEADALVIAYNFDESSRRYVRYSMANKLPECLASGAVTLAHGPRGIATIDYLAEHGCALIIDSADKIEIENQLLKTISDIKFREKISSKAKKFVLSAHNIAAKREEFMTHIRNTIGSDNKDLPIGIPTYTRSAAATVDETSLISKISELSGISEGVMIDVGAHRGSSLGPFYRRGWNIFAYEPDAINREYLLRTYGSADRVVIDPRAVGENVESNVEFYSSDESSGISGMLAFRDSHRLADKVDVTTVAEIVKDNGLSHIDFLKIDVEGYDFSVLKGVPWDSISPDIIECEFEDEKTKFLGHSWKAIAEYLRDKGYHVYVSEWHPIIRYGISHDWHTIKKYPCVLNDERAWGNLLAFKNDPGLKAMAGIIGSEVRFNSSNQEENLLVKSSSAVKPKRQRLYVRAAEALRTRSMVLFRLAQSIMWGLRLLKRRPFLSLVAAFFIIGLPAAPYLDQRFVGYAPELWVASVFLVALLLLLVGISFVNLKLTSYRDSLRREVLAQLNSSSKKILELDKVLKARINDQYHRHDDLAAVVDELIDAVSAEEERGRKTSGRLEVQQGQLANQKAKVDDLIGISGKVDGLTGAVEQLTSLRERDLDELGKRHEDVAARLIIQEGTQEEIGTRLEKQEDKQAEVSDMVLFQDDLAQRVSEQSEKHASLADNFSVEQKRLLKLEGQMISHEENNQNQISGLETKLRTEVEGKYGHLIPKAPLIGEADTKFNRELTMDHATILIKEWAKKLNIHITKHHLSYLAERVSVIESNSRGRLAANIEDAVLRILVASAVRNEDLEVLEIGTLFGIGLAIMYDYLRPRYASVHLTAIDPLEGYYGKQPRDVMTDEIIDENSFRNNLKRAGVSDSEFSIVKHMSTEDAAIGLASDRSYDVMVIDGDHSYAGVKSDLVNYIGVMNRGGYIIFDDYDSPDWPDVKDFVDGWVMKDERLALVGTSWHTAVFRVISVS